MWPGQTLSLSNLHSQSGLEVSPAASSPGKSNSMATRRGLEDCCCSSAAVLLQEALLVTIEKDKLEQLQEPQPLFCLLSFVVESFSSTCSFSASGNLAACGIARC